MTSSPPRQSTSYDSVRRAAVSRRGGVRVRGGRLPPIRIRDVPQVTSAKKTFAPKIPQRRVKVENTEPAEQPGESQQLTYSELQRSRGGRRGRGGRVFVQTEGTFLGQGPAARIKKEPVDYEKVSISRAPRKEREQPKSELEIRENREKIDGLLDSYDENEAYFNDFGYILPMRLPLLKYECKKKIKQEPIDIEEPKEEIKEDSGKEGSTALKSKLAPIKEKCFKKETTSSFIKDLECIEDEGLLILLQLPSSLPLSSDDNEKPSGSACGKEKKTKEEVKKVASSFLENMPEGFIGKMQILKSGRMQLVMGPIIFELEHGSESESQKEVVSVEILDDERNMTVLGKIDRKMIVQPLLPNIFQQMKYEDNIQEKLVEGDGGLIAQ